MSNILNCVCIPKRIKWTCLASHNICTYIILSYNNPLIFIAVKPNIHLELDTFSICGSILQIALRKLYVYVLYNEPIICIGV